MREVRVTSSTTIWRDISPLMTPRRIAVVGASQREVRANKVVHNLQRLGFSGDIYPINPKYSEIMGLRCYPDISSTPDKADCVVLAIPGRLVPDVLASAVNNGIQAAVILSSGFGEAGEEGQQLQRELERLSREQGLLICGPNCYGLFNVSTSAAAFSGGIPAPLIPGNVALISQSGGFTNVVANPLMEKRGIGFSYLISCGNQAGVTVEEFINYLIEDPNTQVIGAFVEGFKRPDQLIEVGRKALRAGKPVVVVKVGKSEVGGQATMAHTGSLAGSGDVFAAALSQGGFIQAGSLKEMAETLALCSCPTVLERFQGGLGIGVLTGSGGECAYVADAAEEYGLSFPPLGESTLAALRGILPAFGSPRNPLDGTGAMYEDSTVFPRLLDSLVNDKGISLAAVHFDMTPRLPGAGGFHELFHKAMAEIAPTVDKPLVAFAAMAGGERDSEAIVALRKAGVAFLDGTEPAMAACRNLAKFTEFRAAFGQEDQEPTPPLNLPADLLAFPAGILPAVPSFGLLEAVGIKTSSCELATSAHQAAIIAERIGFPVVLKIESLQIQGVLVQSMAKPGIEIILGLKRDPVFGPVVVCGLGGIFVEVLRDAVIAVPPFTEAEALKLLKTLRGWKVLDGARGRPRADTQALARAMVSLSHLALALGDRVAGLDINPLIVYPEGAGLMAVDALVEYRD